MNNEIWKDVKGYEGLYRISNLGNLESLHNNKRRLLKKRYDPKGYVRYMLCNGITQKQLRAHRLVALAFIKNPNELTQVNHIDEIKDNNNVSNLEWIDNRGNKNHSCNPKSTSVFPGVSWYGPRGKWLAQCWADGRRNFIGYFEKEDDAAKAYVSFCNNNNLHL